MPHKSPLRRRIVGAYLVLAIVLGTCFAGIGYVSVRLIENQLINLRLERAADVLIDDRLRGIAYRLPGYPVVLYGSGLTPLMRTLPPGVHEIDMDARALHILVRDRGGERFVVMDDESDFERIERYVIIALIGAFVLCLVLAGALGLGTASAVIAPVISLARAVETEVSPAQFPHLHAQDELGVLAQAFAQRSEQMQRFLLREQLFTGDVSHELRTPLTVMLGAAELLQVRLADRPDLQEIAQRIRRTAADTAERVGALLLLSRAPQAMELQPVDLVPLLQQEIERCRPVVQGKPVELRLTAVEPSIWVRGRPELAAIAFGNLIRNACQFTNAGCVEVIAGTDRVIVEDTGPGIPEEVRATIFERFVRAAPAEVAGTGLGLAIVRRVAEHLGWEVALERSAGGGSRFVVTLASGVAPGN